MKGQLSTNLPFIIFFVSFAVLLVFLSVEFEAAQLSNSSSLHKPSCSGVFDCPFTYLGFFLAMMSISSSYATINGTILLILGVGLAWAIFELISNLL